MNMVLHEIITQASYAVITLVFLLIVTTTKG